jgi:hypothetical protein
MLTLYLLCFIITLGEKPLELHATTHSQVFLALDFALEQLPSTNPELLGLMQ